MLQIVTTGRDHLNLFITYVWWNAVKNVKVKYFKIFVNKSIISYSSVQNKNQICELYF